MPALSLRQVAPLSSKDNIIQSKVAPPHLDLEIKPVTLDYKKAFFSLILEQAEQHASTVAHDEKDIDALYKSIGKQDGMSAFLVTDRKTEAALGAVTYFWGVGDKGPHIYLDDIVTTRSVRNRGVGSFALATLAKIALNKGASHIALECAYHNLTTQKFYSDLGAERFEDRHTWRKLGLLKQAAKETTARSSVCEIRAMQPFDADCVADLFAKNGNADQGLVESIRLGTVTAQPDFVLAVAENDCGSMVGAGIAYRSFSSFRCVSGVHVARIVGQDSSPCVGEAFLDHFAAVQQDRGWNGHLDLTIDNSDAAFWTPVLTSFGIEPLSYGNDPMVVRCFSGNALQSLARRADMRTDTNLQQENNPLVNLRHPHRLVSEKRYARRSPQ